RPEVCLKLPSDSISLWTPLLLAMCLPLQGRTWDFHPLEFAHAGRTKRERSLGLSLGHLSYSFQLSTKSSLSSTHFSAPANGSSSLSCTSTIKSSNSSSSNSKFCIQLYTSS